MRVYHQTDVEGMCSGIVDCLHSLNVPTITVAGDPSLALAQVPLLLIQPVHAYRHMAIVIHEFFKMTGHTSFSLMWNIFIIL